MPSKIEWTDETWNLVRGCIPSSPGCKNCYAKGQANRQKGPGQKYEGLVEIRKSGPEWTGAVRTFPKELAKPLHWRAPRHIFPVSMGDLFLAPLRFIAAVFGVISLSAHHTYQLLTKQADELVEFHAWLRATPLCGRRSPSPLERCTRSGCDAFATSA